MPIIFLWRKLTRTNRGEEKKKTNPCKIFKPASIEPQSSSPPNFLVMRTVCAWAIGAAVARTACATAAIITCKIRGLISHFFFLFSGRVLDHVLLTSYLPMVDDGRFFFSRLKNSRGSLDSGGLKLNFGLVFRCGWLIGGDFGSRTLNFGFGSRCRWNNGGVLWGHVTRL